MDNDAVQKPSMPHYQRHVLLCSGKHCDRDGSRSLIRYMKEALEGLGIGQDQVRVNRAGCLGVCTQGALMCVYPEAVWYCGVDQAAIDRIIQQHLLGDEVVTELQFHHNRFDQSRMVDGMMA